MKKAIIIIVLMVSLLQQLRYLINGSYISNRIWLAAAITSDGRVQMSYSGDDINNFIIRLRRIFFVSHYDSMQFIC